MGQYEANMGGTNIYQPMQHVLNLKVGKSYQKKIFLLTDGDVSDSDRVIELVKKCSKIVRVHTFGVGSGCSKYLIKKVG